MKVIRAIKYCLDQIVRLQRGLPQKQYSEWNFWRQEISRYIDWYEGKIDYLWGVPRPPDEIKITGYGLKENAIRTWAYSSANKTLKYPRRLFIPRDYFSEKRILDVGCGPIPCALAFIDCEIYGLDQLVDEFKELGFPLDDYSERLTYVQGSAESMPFEDNFFDAVISVNAIDHVDDFSAAAKEISRVLRPEGTLRMETHYHQPTTTEPWSLNDDMVIKHFGHLGIRKVHERPFTEVNLEVPERGEKLVVWANRD